MTEVTNRWAIAQLLQSKDESIERREVDVGSETSSGILRTSSRCSSFSEDEILRPKERVPLLNYCGVDLTQIVDEGCKKTLCDPIAEELEKAGSCQRLAVVCGEGCVEGISRRAEIIKRRTLCNPAEDFQKILRESGKTMLCGSLIDEWKQTVASRAEMEESDKECKGFEKEKAEIVERLAQFYPDSELRKAMADVELERQRAALNDEFDWLDIEEKSADNESCSEVFDGLDDAPGIEVGSLGHSDLEYAFDFLERARTGESLMSQIEDDESDYLAIPKVSNKSMWLAEFHKLNTAEGAYSPKSMDECSVLSGDETIRTGSRTKSYEKMDNRKLGIAVSAGQMAADSEDNSVVRPESPMIRDVNKSLDEIELEMFIPAEFDMEKSGPRMSVIKEEPALEEHGDELLPTSSGESASPSLDSVSIQQCDPSTSYNKRWSRDSSSGLLRLRSDTSRDSGDSCIQVSDMPDKSKAALQDMKHFEAAEARNERLAYT